MVHWHIKTDKKKLNPKELARQIFYINFIRLIWNLRTSAKIYNLIIPTQTLLFEKKLLNIINFFTKCVFKTQDSRQFFAQHTRWSVRIPKTLDDTTPFKKPHARLSSIKNYHKPAIFKHRHYNVYTLVETFIKFYAASSLHDFRPAKAYRSSLFSPGPSAGSYVISIKRFFYRWRCLYFITLNIFYFNSQSLSFGSYFSRNEVLALNWNTNLLSLTEWKNSSPMFFSKVKNFSRMFATLLNRLKVRGLSIVFVSDPFVSRYLYLRAGKANIFSIGLYPAVEMPWIASFPVPSFGYGGASQVFFLQLVHSLHRKATMLTYNKYFKTWNMLN